jgi:hypothetical protein
MKKINLKYNFRRSGTISVWLIILACIASCSKTVDNIKLPEVPPKLVVYSYISPADTIIQVNVSMSVPIFNSTNNNSDNIVKDATVTMWDDFGSSITIPYDPLTKTYNISSSALPIIAGRTYHLKVVSGDKTAESGCTVPSEPNTSLQFVSMDSTLDENNQKIITLKVKFTDTPGQPDYYRVYPMVYGVQYFMGLTDTITNKIYFDFGNELVSDKDHDGLTYNYTATYYYMTEVPIYFKVFLFHTDKDYYELHKSIYNYQGDNPFSEPTLIYSNMSGGYGVFAAFNPYSIKVYI